MRLIIGEEGLVLPILTASLPLVLAMGRSMAAHAIVDLGYPFFQMFGNDVRRLMRVTAEARIPFVGPPFVARRAGRVVISIQGKKPGVIECCWFPSGRLVAGRAIRCRPLVQPILRRDVTALASGSDIGFQQRMVKLNCAGFGPCRLWMIAVAGHAVRLGQCLVECAQSWPLCDLHPLRGSQTNIGDDMAGYATLGGGALKRGMAGKAIALQFGMGRDQVSGTDHLMGPGEAEGHDPSKRQHQPNPDRTVHFQPQNRNVETICAVAKAANAIAIGRWILRHFRTQPTAKPSQNNVCAMGLRFG